MASKKSFLQAAAASDFYDYATTPDSGLLDNPAPPRQAMTAESDTTHGDVTAYDLRRRANRGAQGISRA
ncbi:proteinase inhibitor I4 serpin [Rhodovulum sulfidophilum]|uniref:Proteinase inhibitor I4 serpin n=1 Tax=Rhodovulum sulfidophilum TaxID=35806 RepID=A0A0D6B7Y7_RHOSU|nr:proteinase inhibitor I4 serpin [Rhodovulum sulfidophilum]